MCDLLVGQDYLWNYDVYEFYVALKKYPSDPDIINHQQVLPTCYPN